MPKIYSLLNSNSPPNPPTMSSPEIYFLDVGHGNSTVLRDSDGAMVIDCPQTSTLLETLEASGILDLSYVIVSHADDDHVAGIITLLLCEHVRVREVYLNPDAS